jgi:hypothetical protein
MMRGLLRTFTAIGLFAVGLAFIAPATASAHERRTVAGDYTFVVGFLKEPAFQDETNGIDLRVSKSGDQPVEGLEKTLKAEVVVGPNTLPLELHPRFRVPGAYNGEFVPTRPGSYTFRFTGTVEGKPVKETFESGPGRFNDVEAVGPLQFPDKVPSGVELERAVAAAESRASTATTLGAVGLAAGLLGVLLAAWSLASRRRAPSAAGTSPSSASRVAPATSQERL